MEKANRQVVWSRLDVKKHKTPSAKRRFERRQAERENPNSTIKNDKPVEEVCLSNSNLISPASNAAMSDKQREIENVYRLKQEILKREEAVARREIEYKKKMNELWFEKEKMSLHIEVGSMRNQLPKMTTKFWKTPAPIDGIPKRRSWLDYERYNKKLFVGKSKQIAVEDLFEEPHVFNYSPEQNVPLRMVSSLDRRQEEIHNDTYRRRYTAATRNFEIRQRKRASNEEDKNLRIYRARPRNKWESGTKKSCDTEKREYDRRA